MLVNEEATTAESNRLYYNKIANEYDTILKDEVSNAGIRNIVKEKFTSVVAPGLVLDFGGGTGLDLGWLLSNKYRVIFCEPSEKMREKAINGYKDNSSIKFLDSANVDFRTWHSKQTFTEKLDGVLADFAVFNCIENIELLFKNLALVMKPGAHLIILMLKHGDQKSLYWKLREQVRSIISSKALLINVTYQQHKQIVFVYSFKEIEKASSTYFHMKSHEHIKGFTLFHFIKNE